jgi:hypothetical protein
MLNIPRLLVKAFGKCFASGNRLKLKYIEKESSFIESLIGSAENFGIEVAALKNLLFQKI